MNRSFRQLLAIACVALAVSLSAGCSDGARTAQPPAASPSGEDMRALRTVLITIDTLRNDRVGSTYEDRIAVTPRLDALATRGVRFLTAISPVPITLPSHTTILSGLQPPRHGVRANSTFSLDPHIPTLASRAHAAGIATGAFVGAVVLGRHYGLARGFDVYDDRMGERRALGKSGYPERQADAVVDAALAWLRPTQPERFFVWLHMYDPHFDHHPPQNYADQMSDDLYAAEIHFADHEVGRFVEEVEAMYPDGRTLFVVTSDHGESLGEHGDPTHSYTLYDATQHVPLIIAGPGIPQGREVPDVVRLADIAPTVLARMALPPLEEADGLDLLPLLDDEPDEPRVAWVETVATRLEHGWSPVYGVRTDRFKYLRAPRPELYAVQEDPGELDDLASTLPGVASDLDARVAAVLETARPLHMTLDPDPEERAQLEALGYVIPDTTIDLDAAVRVGGIDPKDTIEVLTGMSESLRLAQAGKRQEAIDLLLSLETEGGQTDARLGRLFREVGKLDESLVHARRAVATTPGWADTHFELGLTLRALGQLDEARRELVRATELDPANPSPHIALGALAMAQDDLDGAAVHLERAVAGNAFAREAYWRLAAIRLAQDRRDEARELLDALPASWRWRPEIAQNLAVGQVRAGDYKGALKRVRLALRRHPDATALRAFKTELEAALASREDAASEGPPKNG